MLHRGRRYGGRDGADFAVHLVLQDTPRRHGSAGPWHSMGAGECHGAPKGGQNGVSSLENGTANSDKRHADQIFRNELIWATWDCNKPSGASSERA